ncbi:MAG: hypothetical protein EOL87_06755 [Spartobacteria bacterium]|nr:hypothetical protein [Spartobacteria bacterium]
MSEITNIQNATQQTMQLQWSGTDAGLQSRITTFGDDSGESFDDTLARMMSDIGHMQEDLGKSITQLTASDPQGNVEEKVITAEESMDKMMGVRSKLMDAYYRLADG